MMKNEPVAAKCQKETKEIMLLQDQNKLIHLPGHRIILHSRPESSKPMASKKNNRRNIRLSRNPIIGVTEISSLIADGNLKMEIIELEMKERETESEIKSYELWGNIKMKKYNHNKHNHQIISHSLER